MAARSTGPLPIHARDEGVLGPYSRTSVNRFFIVDAYCDHMASANRRLPNTGYQYCHYRTGRGGRKYGSHVIHRPSRRVRELGTAAHGHERLSSTGDQGRRIQVGRCYPCTPVDRGNVKVDEMNRLLKIMLQNLD